MFVCLRDALFMHLFHLLHKTAHIHSTQTHILVKQEKTAKYAKSKT